MVAMLDDNKQKNKLINTKNLLSKSSNMPLHENQE